MPAGFKGTELHSIEEVASGASSPTATLRPSGGHLRVAMDVESPPPGTLNRSRPTDTMPRGTAAIAQALVLVVMWYTMSTALNIYNKKVIGHKYGVLGGEPFPLPMLMSAVQFAMQHVLARSLHGLGIRRQIRASPAESQPHTVARLLCSSTGRAVCVAEEPFSWATWKRTVLPNGVATGLDIALSNASYAFITLSFYTMCKSSSPLFLLLFAFIWGIEKPSWELAGTVSIISMGLLMLVAGEVEFDIRGFLLVITAACMSGLRWTITQVLLQVRLPAHPMPERLQTPSEQCAAFAAKNRAATRCRHGSVPMGQVRCLLGCNTGRVRCRATTASPAGTTQREAPPSR